MPEEITLAGTIRGRNGSQAPNDAQHNATKTTDAAAPRKAPRDSAVGEPDRVTVSSNEEQNDLNVLTTKKRQHPAAPLRKSVLLSVANGTDNGERKSPRRGSMLRRFSRAASFKKAREHLPVNIDLKGILHRFERHSTIHGICHASLAPNKRWRRFWLSVFVLCLIILIIQVIYTAIKFLQYPKTVDLDLKFENAPFPSVTICNLNPYKASAIRNDQAAKATMEALENVLQETGRSEGVAAAISTDNVKKARRALKSDHQHLKRRENEDQPALNTHNNISSTAGTTDWREMALAIHRRYLQVYATCYCEVSRLSSVRKRGSCYAAYKNRVTVRFLENNSSNTADQQHMHYFYPTKCLCQLDWMAKAIWPCFPYNTWKEHICMECVDDHGHCPMRFLDYRTANTDETVSGSSNMPGSSSSTRVTRLAQQRLYGIEMLDENMDICVCHREYNHCVANNLDGEIPEIMPGDDLNLLNISHLTEGVRRRGEVSQAVRMALKTYESSAANDTERETVEQAMGFLELHDEIAIKGQARENLIFAVEEKPLHERIRLSQAKEELILKCSFNQHDCDIEKDFKLFHDPTYGNCYTFNWDRNAQVTAHRAGANYGLRVLVYANVSEYLPITEAVGFRITVHDKWTVPFVDAFGYNAPTGTLSAFGVRMKKFFRLEHPYGHCREGGERAEWYIYNKKENYNYSIEGCHRSCTQREVVRVCGCADPMFPVPQGAVQCRMSDPLARNCLKNTTRQISQLIADGALEGCQCPLPCYETGYEVTYSAANWPSGTTKLMECESNDALCMEKYRINAAMIQVFYEELNYQTLTESPAYSLTSLIADLGGLSGLWIGISVVSILEVVQLIWFCMQYIHKKKTPELLALVRSARQRTTSAGHADKSSSSSSNRSSIRARTESVGAYSLKSLHSVRSDLRPGIRITQERRPSHSTGSSTPYLAPEVELPCTCLYGARGQIVFMKPLCPFHGYMVRRIMMRPHSDEEEDEFDEEEEEADEELLDDTVGEHAEPSAVANDGTPLMLNADEVDALERDADQEQQPQDTLAEPPTVDGASSSMPMRNGTPRASASTLSAAPAGAVRKTPSRRETIKSRRSSSSSTEAGTK